MRSSESAVVLGAILCLTVGCASSTYENLTSGAVHGAGVVSGGSGGSGSGTTTGTTGSTGGAGCFATNPAVDSGVLFGAVLQLPLDGMPSIGFLPGNQGLVPDTCLGPPVNDGGCCLGSEVIETSLEGLPSAGPISVTDNQATLGELAVGLGGFYAYTGTALSVAQPGDSLGFVAQGSSFPAFSGTLSCPGPVTVLSAPDAGLLSLGSDLTVTWLPDSGAPAVNVMLLQTSGMESCFESEGLITAEAPLYITCSVPTAQGSVTLPRSLFGDAGFVVGATAQLTVSGQSAAAQLVMASGQSPSVSEVQATATAPSFGVPLVFGP